MSNALGAVRFGDGTVMFYEYYGTSDQCFPTLYKTGQEVSDNWRKGVSRTCECGKAEPVEIFTSYGGGSYWPGTACKVCMGMDDTGSRIKQIYPGFCEEDHVPMADGIPQWAEAHFPDMVEFRKKRGLH